MVAPVSACSSRGDGPSWRSWTEISSGSSFLAHRMMAQAEQDERAAEAEAEQRRVELRGVLPGLVVERPPDVRDDEAEREQAAQHQQQRDRLRSTRFSALVPGTGNRGA